MIKLFYLPMGFHRNLKIGTNMIIMYASQLLYLQAIAIVAVLLTNLKLVENQLAL